MPANDDGVDEWHFYVQSMYGHHTQQPLVSIKLHDIAVQATPEKAREMAAMLLECAEAAEGDAFLVEWSRAALGVSERESTALLQEFRGYREKNRDV